MAPFAEYRDQVLSASQESELWFSERAVDLDQRDHYRVWFIFRCEKAPFGNPRQVLRDNTLQIMNVSLSPTSGQVAAPQPSAEPFRGLSVGSIRNPKWRSSIDSKYALDARAVSRLNFELWTSKPRIRTS